MGMADAQHLALVALAAVLAPLVAELTRSLVPSVVLEILFGVLIGPAVLGWVDASALISALASFGLALLMFLAGYEIDLDEIRGQPLRRAGSSWLGSVALAGAVGLLVAATGHGSAAIYVALPLCTTALGTLLPILARAGVLSSRLGPHVLAVGSLGEFGPIVLIAMLFGGRSVFVVVALLAGLALATLAATYLARHPRTGWLRELAYRELRSPTQLAVRLAMLLIVGFVVLAGELSFDFLMGSFAAGLVVRATVSGSDRLEEAQLFGDKLQAVGYGVLIPIFFVVSGIQIDVRSLVTNPAGLLLIPGFLALLLVCRAGPALVGYRGVLDAASTRALALFASTSLPLIVVVSTLGTQSEALSTTTAAAMVMAGLLSVLVFPAVAERVVAGRRSRAS